MADDRVTCSVSISLVLRPMKCLFPTPGTNIRRFYGKPHMILYVGYNVSYVPTHSICEHIIASPVKHHTSIRNIVKHFRFSARSKCHKSPVPTYKSLQTVFIMYVCRWWWWWCCVLHIKTSGLNT